MNTIKPTFQIDVQSLETIAPGIYHTMLHSGQIYFMKFETAERASLDAYRVHAIDSINALDTSQPRLALLDFAHSSLLYSPYLKAQNDLVMDCIRQRGLRGRTAIISLKSPMVVLGRSIINAYLARVPQMQVKLFFEQAEGFEWLLED
jgi:hypothetical protein